MFEITKDEFQKDSYGKEEYLENWPMLYMLDDGRKMYIGQTNQLNVRMKRHRNDEEKRDFKTLHMIYSQLFNLSATTDYESKLIQHMFADRKYKLTNDNKGFADRKFHEQPYYEELFPKLWEELKERNLVTSEIEEIRNSDFFKYSPYKDLTTEQWDKIHAILDILETKENPKIMVEGMPGSGKTVICTFLMKYLKELDAYKDKKIALVVPQVSLRATLQKLFRQIEGMSGKDIIGPTDVKEGGYDILIVDEAHRLVRRKNISYLGPYDRAAEKLGLDKEKDQMDWIIQASKAQIFIYDAMQVVGPAGIKREIVTKKLKEQERLERYVECFTLYSQMRVKGGRPYIDYIADILNERLNRRKSIVDYEFKLIERFARFEELLCEKEVGHRLSRMIAGFAWEWKSKKDKTQIDIVIEGMEKQWNYTNRDWVNSAGAVDQIGCIHSVQGYDLNYGFVIIGNDLKYRDGHIIVDADEYYDKNGKNTATEEDLLSYIKNIYYVLMTRGIKGTYLYICDEELRSYFKKYVETE